MVAGAKDMFDMSWSGSKGRLSVLVVVMCPVESTRSLVYSLHTIVGLGVYVPFTYPGPKI